MLAALAISGYLLWSSGWNAQPAGCGNDGWLGCDEVLTSPWARWLGVPVTLLALVVYGATLLGSFLIGRQVSERVRGIGWRGLLCLSSMMIGAACWFIGLQVVELRSYCPKCLAVHACGVVAAALILWQGFRHARLGSGQAILVLLLGIAWTASLIAGQMVLPSASGQVVPRTSPPPPVVAAGEKITSVHVVQELFDYNCAQCRKFHRDLKLAQERYGDQLSVVLLPMAMCQSCNRYVVKTAPGHELACEYARLALAVKRIDAAAFLPFHNWLMDPDEIPSLAAARTHAAGLVGTERLERMLASPLVEADLQQNIAIYAQLNQGRIPKLITQAGTLVGRFPPEQLFPLLEKYAGLKAP
jgi:uncharacterized membrane protein/protein-disulfide isomerase